MVYVCDFVRYRAVRDVIINFSGHHLRVQWAVKFDQTVNDGVAHFKNPRKCAYHVTLTLTLSTPWMHADLESIL